MDFLTQIIADTRKRHQEKIAGFSKTEFLKQLPTLTPTQPETTLKKLLEDFFLIAECKKASPSQGILNPNYDPVRIAKEYEAGGAKAISVLTEEKFFQGSPDHLREVREAVSLPILWKDFIIHEKQISQARILGADLILLIFRILPEKIIYRFLDFTISCGLVPLVEIFNGDEPSKIIRIMEKYSGKCLIGINNRDLTTFHTDIAHSEKMYRSLSSIHKDFPFISESGIKTPQDILQLKNIGFQGALVGESLIKQSDHQSAVKQLLIK